jgi:hypothetical protein
LRWDNSFKEVYWRLLIDALPTSLRLHAPEQTCVWSCVPWALPPLSRLPCYGSSWRYYCSTFTS